METKSYLSVTELPGDEITKEQLERLHSRYYWASQYCQGKDVLEIGCGAGPGLGYLARFAKKIVAGDISEDLLIRAQTHYGDRISILKLDALDLPFQDCSQDVILLFEAIYYLKDIDKFLSHCRRILRTNGKLLIASANRDLYDFNSSPLSTRYYNAIELKELLSRSGFKTEFFGDWPVIQISLKQKLLRPIKKIAVFLNLIPKTMQGKKFLKKLVFGKLEKMPAEIEPGYLLKCSPERIPDNQPIRDFKVIFCAAELKEN